MTTELKNELLELAKQVGITLGLILLTVLLCGGSLVQVLWISCIPYGWMGLNKITPSVFLCLPFVGWVVYIITKLVLSAFVGAFIMVYKLGIRVFKVIYVYKNQVQA